MIAIDTSALIAILNNEVEAEAFAEILVASSLSLLSAASLLECAMVIESRYGLAGGIKLDELLVAANIQVEVVTLEQAGLARQAFRAYGKGRHPAGLNFGDCFAYALAKQKQIPLLFKGNDFSQTDIVPAFLPD